MNGTLSCVVRDTVQQYAISVEALLARWRETSVRDIWLRPDDWFTSANEAAVERLIDRQDVSPAAYRLGENRATAGVGIGETIDDLTALYRVVGIEAPPMPVLRALCDGWAEAMAAIQVGAGSDAESGLSSRDYLVRRLKEIYGRAARLNERASDCCRLLVVDVAVDAVDPWQRIARNAAVGDVLTDIFGEGHSIARLGDGHFAVLVEPDEGVDAVSRLKSEIISVSQLLDMERLLRQPPRVWLEPLPRDFDCARELVLSLGR